jgi:hypothetical protein
MDYFKTSHIENFPKELKGIIIRVYGMTCIMVRIRNTASSVT